MKSEAAFILEHAGWPALLVDDAGKILRANDAAVKTFGPILKGSAPLLSALWSPENGNSAEQFLAHWLQAPTPTQTLRLRAATGNMAGFTVSLCAAAHAEEKWFLLQLLPEARPADPRAGPDVTLHRQKLDCALQLARTVALDFNNALTSILGHTSLLLSKTEPKHPWRGSLLEVEKSAARAAEIANDLAVFSLQDKDARGQATGNLNTLLQRCAEILQRAKPEGVDWRFRLERRLYAARFDEAKIQQALVKILENAVESLPGSGQLTIQTRNVELNEATQDRNVQLSPGNYVCIEIADTGQGIAEDVLPRVFEPFFTTKRDKHRGLGLALVYGIITNHGGGVAISSQPGSGTSVRTYLPAARTFVSESLDANMDLRGTETVLVVDDEDLLLTMMDTVLGEYGYRVLKANSGAKALEILRKPELVIDLVVTDLVMPIMSGRELVEQIHREGIPTRIICASGYVWPANSTDPATYLQKPFTSQELLTKIRNVLGTNTSGGPD